MSRLHHGLDTIFLKTIFAEKCHALSDITMFGLYCARPPTPQMLQASAVMEQTSSYLFKSTDPTRLYLDSALAKVRNTSQILSQTKGNGTCPCAQLHKNRGLFLVYDGALAWLSAHYGVSKATLDSKYPNMMRDMLAEDSQVKSEPYYYVSNWATEQDHELPNLMSEFLHRGRLGPVIDEALGLDNSETKESTVDTSSASKLIVA
jgi:hypothetical protein